MMMIELISSKFGDAIIGGDEANANSYLQNIIDFVNGALKEKKANMSQIEFEIVVTDSIIAFDITKSNDYTIQYFAEDWNDVYKSEFYKNFVVEAGAKGKCKCDINTLMSKGCQCGAI